MQAYASSAISSLEGESRGTRGDRAVCDGGRGGGGGGGTVNELTSVDPKIMHNLASTPETKFG